MFDDDADEAPARRTDPEQAARDKLEELRMYAELAAVFEGPRKFDHDLRRDLPSDLAQRLQRGMLTLERARPNQVQILPDEQVPLARELLSANDPAGLTCGDYHACVRPGQVVMARWIRGEDFDVFHERLLAHFDAMLAGHIEDEESARAWQGDPSLPKYLESLEKFKPNLADRYLVAFVRSGRVPACLSTHTADELNIAFLAETVMGLSVPEVVGPQAGAATSDEDDDDAYPDESALAWYFKLYLLRGTVERVPTACFFAFLQKTSNEW